jgi:hypothetical protein
MTFLLRPGSPRYTAQLHARALQDWRAAARLVADEWDRVLVAAPRALDDAFAGYVAALDAEAAAADELAGLYLRDAVTPEAMRQ